MENRREKKMMAAAGRYASVRFVLGYTLYYETEAERTKRDEADSPVKQELDAVWEAFGREFHALIGRFLEGDIPETEAETFRSRFISKTEELLDIAGSLAVYGSVLKRMSRRFMPEEASSESDENIVNQIMRYIISESEPAQRNERIRTVLSELPLRMTRAKFFSLVCQALSVYEGTDKYSLEQMIKHLKREALLPGSSQIRAHYPGLSQILEKLEQTDYIHMDAETFLPLWTETESIGNYLINQITDSQDQMNVINDFCVLCFTHRDLLMDSGEKEMIHQLITMLWKNMEEGNYSVNQRKLYQLLHSLEGRQEMYYEQLARYDLPDNDGFDGEEELSEEKERLRKVSLLLSSSDFMSLEREKKPEGTDILLSRKAVEELCQPFLDALEADWKGKPKCVIRVIMAKLLGELPMFFTTSDDLREFITGCFDSCTDIAEKEECIQAIKEEMESDDDLV